MTKRKGMTLDQAKRMAADWQAQREDHDREAALRVRFSDANANQVIAMWETGKNERGRPLTRFELQALGERWCEVFGELPPDIGNGKASNGSSDGHTTPEPEPDDDTMLHMPDVVRLTGISESTIKRMVEDDRFPKPLHLSPRRIGWPAREIRGWINRLEEQRAAPRQ